MRLNRTALAVVLAYTAALTVTIALATPARPQGAPPWKFSVHRVTRRATTPPSPDDQRVMDEIKRFEEVVALDQYAAAVTNAERERQAQAAAAAQAARLASPPSSAPAGPTSPPATTTPAPAGWAGEVPSVGSATVWRCIIQRESGGDPAALNPSSGAGGLFQFLPSSWLAYGGTGLPQNASVAEQVQVATNAYGRSGYSPWTGDNFCGF